MFIDKNWLVYFDCYAYLDKDSISELNQLYSEDQELLETSDFPLQVKLSLSFCPLTNKIKCVAVQDKAVLQSGYNENFFLDHDLLKIDKL